MGTQEVETLIVGAGQAGLAMSAHLRDRQAEHLVLERHRIVERWRSERWDSLVANGPAWHDRFPAKEFTRSGPDEFPSKTEIVDYFVDFAKEIEAPIRCGVEVTRATAGNGGQAFRVETSDGVILARNLVAATGPFQRPVIPNCVPEQPGLTQIHSNAYRNPDQLAQGAVLVVGAGSSGGQIADELQRAGRKVYLSVGPHDRPPRRYRGKDFVWWLGVLGKWDAIAPDPSTEHVTISVSGANGGHTVDFRRLAAQGITLLGRVQDMVDGQLQIAPDLAQNIARGDANYLSVLQEADAYAEREGLDLPPEPEAHQIGPAPDCAQTPILSLDLKREGITTIIWATGYTLDFSWLEFDIFEPSGRPRHHRGVSDIPGLYFIGLPWLSCRGSAFIWGAWTDAQYLADQITARSQSAVA